MGNGNIDVGNKIPSRESSQPGLWTEKPASQQAEGRKICGAMSQQRGDNGNESAPQKFVQLVGCRDPKAQPWIRPVAPKR